MAKVVIFEFQGKNLEKIIRNQDELRKAIKDTQKDLERSDFGSAKYNKANAQLQALLNTQKDVREDNKNLQRQLIVTADASNKSYTAMQAQLKLLESRFFALSRAEQRAQIGKQLAKDIRGLRDEIKQVNKELGKGGLEGAFKSAITTLGGAGLIITGVAEGVRSLTNFIGDSITVFADFNRQISFLGAVSGASAEEVAELRDLARSLGESTQFTASQVAQLEIEYAKLGFKPAEILNTTAATLNLATVAQEDLGRTATVVGATIRSYNFDASESTRVTDVLAKSFSSSALDLSKFETAFAQVGPVAAAANLPFEQTVALMGILADRGVDASTVGSGLRNVFLDLAAKGLTLTEALKQINEAEDGNVKSLELFGKRGATIGTILAGTEAQVKSLQETLEGASGFAAEAGKTIAGDFKGSFEVFASTIEGFKLNLIDLFDGAIKSVIGGITAIIAALSSFLVTLQRLPAFIQENKTEIIGLGVALIGLNSAAIAANATILITNARTLAMAAAQRGAAIATNILTIAQRGLNAAMKANPIGIIITAVGLLITLFGTLRKRSQTVEATFQGLKAIALELFNIFKEGFRAFGEGFQQIKEGNIGAGLRAIGTGLSKFNPVTVAIFEGKRLGKAFNKGYSDSLAEGAAEQKVQDQVNESAKQATAIQGDLSAATDETAEATARLKNKLNEAAIATDNFALGSVAQLRQEIRGLQEELDRAAEGDQAGILSKLIDAEKALDEVEEFQAILRRRLTSEGAFATLDPIGTIQVTATKSATDDILEEYRNRNRQIKEEEADLAEFFKGLQDEIFSGINRASSLLSEASQGRADREIQSLEDRYEREIELAEGNERRQEALREELSNRTREIEREEFERQKRFRIASALSSLAEGIINILSAPTTIPDPFGSVFKGIRIGFLTGTTFAQIAAINRQTAARGILIEKPRRMDKGGMVGGFAYGATHADISGGIDKIFNNQRVLIEHGEFTDTDEFGGVGVINKRSAAAFRPTLNRISGVPFAGKRKLLSDINSYRNWGVAYAQRGGIIEPSISSIARAAVDTSGTFGGSLSATVSRDSAQLIAERTAEAVERVIFNSNRQMERERALRKRTGI